MSLFKLRGGGKLMPEDRTLLANLYKDGASIGSLAKRFGINPKSAKNLIVARSIPIRPYEPQARRERKWPAHSIPVHERWATRRLERSIARGLMIRPKSCSVCGCDGKINGHHDDYNKPLSVRWLCSSCHADWHSKHIPVPSKRAMIEEFDRLLLCSEEFLMLEVLSDRAIANLYDLSLKELVRRGLRS